jgi:hypothetical protein
MCADGKSFPAAIVNYKQVRMYVKGLRSMGTDFYYLCQQVPAMSEYMINGIPVNFPFEPYSVQSAYMEKVLECLKKVYHFVLYNSQLLAL